MEGNEVPVYVIENMLQIREIGKHNMLAMNDVLNQMMTLEMYDSALWLINTENMTVNSSRYTKVLTAMADHLHITNMLSRDC